MDFNPDTDLELRRHIKASPTTIWRCWTEPELLREWFCPKPWQVTEAILDPRPGGRFMTVMQGPNGEGETCSNTSEGCYLEIVPNKRLVFTDGLRAGFRPNASGFMTGIITLTDDGDGGTHYLAQVLHHDAETRKKHEDMGFAEGWGAATTQLEDLVKRL